MDRDFWGAIWAVSSVLGAILVFGWILIGRDEEESF